MDLSDAYRHTIDALKVRRRGYQLTFGNNRIVTSLKRAYVLAFGNYAGQAVLSDLAKFCRATRPTWSEDERHHARLEGRREVWLRITEHLNLTSEQLFALYGGHNIQIQPPKEDDHA